MDERLSEIEEIRSTKYEPFKRIVDDFESFILSKPLERWAFSTALFLRHLGKHISGGLYQPGEIIDFWKSYGQLIYQTLASEIRPSNQLSNDNSLSNTTPYQAIIHGMHHISEVLMEDETIEYEPHHIFHLSFEEMCKLL